MSIYIYIYYGHLERSNRVLYNNVHDPYINHCCQDNTFMIEGRVGRWAGLLLENGSQLYHTIIIHIFQRQSYATVFALQAVFAIMYIYIGTYYCFNEDFIIVRKKPSLQWEPSHADDADIRRRRRGRRNVYIFKRPRENTTVCVHVFTRRYIIYYYTCMYVCV